MRLSATIAILGALLSGCADSVAGGGWTVTELGTNAELRDVFFLDAQRGWVVGGGRLVDGGIVGSTTDGGISWRFASGITAPDRRATSFHLNAVWFLDERTGFIAADGFHLLRTVDGGELWHPVLPTRRVSAHLHDLSFVDDRFGWAVGTGGMARTGDGGATWEGPLLEGEGRDVRYPGGRAIHFVDPEHGWLVGANGRIRTTADGGTSWSDAVSASSNEPTLWGVDFVDGRMGWAVGDRGTILHSTDGGQTWNPQASGVADTLMDVDFVDRLYGWVVGFERSDGSAVVLHTRDGGVSWSEQERVSTESARAVFALDRQHAWAVGEQQRRTADDGTQKLLRYEANEPAR